MIVGGIIGFGVGLIFGIMGIPTETIKIVTGFIGALVGIAFSILPMKMILGKDFGEFKLVLLSKSERNEPGLA